MSKISKKKPLGEQNYNFIEYKWWQKQGKEY